MFKLYHHGSSVCAAKVRLVLEEKDVEYEKHYLDILKGDQFDPDYLKINPKGVVPTLIHDEEVIFESSVTPSIQGFLVRINCEAFLIFT